MDLPYYLNQGIEKELGNIKLSAISKARTGLSEKYRSSGEKNKKLITSSEERIAYIATRLPSIFAVINTIISKVQKMIPGLKVENILDLGSGPGTVMFAATEILNVNNITLVEKDRAFIEIGKRLAANSNFESVKNADWEIRDINSISDIPSHDLVTASYVLNELSEKEITRLVDITWEKAKQLIIFVEPGTPAGFKNIRLVREKLIQMAANIIAPCPHNNECPMMEGDWCHFSKRVERTKYHRILKDGDLSYEDEKFSYIVASRTPVKLPDARVIRHPKINKGHLELKVCGENGLKEFIVSRKENEIYKKAQKIKWGDEWN
jgi:ribosomal protein RSM22 (predicted rRNA methylase)